MVFELLAQSLFDYLKDNSFSPFPLKHIKSFAFQLLTSVKFLHSIKLIHTDLKPENIMICDIESRQPRSSERRKVVRPKELVDTGIRLIDFGSAIFEDDHHTSVVSTRHYRAPEILLGMGWSFPCDVWSIGMHRFYLF
jgi:dual-specificity kinase